jgi:hypothetical protein
MTILKSSCNNTYISQVLSPFLCLHMRNVYAYYISKEIVCQDIPDIRF